MLYILRLSMELSSHYFSATKRFKHMHMELETLTFNMNNDEKLILHNMHRDHKFSFYILIFFIFFVNAGMAKVK